MEFQAVVFAAGIGSRFRDLVGNRPKCLLPVGPYPLIYYPLNFCSKYGFEEIIIIVLESQKNEIMHSVAKLPLKLKYEFITLNQESDFGTADALRLVSEKIYTDVLLISCDTVTNIDFYPVLNMFRMNDASLVSLFFKGNESVTNVVVPGPSSKHKQERDLVGINLENNRLLFLASTTDFQENLSLPGHLLRTHGKIVMHSGLTDSHIYLVKKWVVSYLAKNEKFSTVKGEMLPFVIKKQMSRPSNPVNAGYSEMNFDTNDIFEHVKHNELSQKILETNLNNFSRLKRSHNAELIKCYAYIAPSTFRCIRVNTIFNYCLVNKDILALFESICGSDNSNAALISRSATIKSTQISDCAVAENTTISEKTSIKKSIFGVNCDIHQKTIINDSIVMNNVTVEENVMLDNCIICDRAVIKKGSILKNCLVGHNFIVQEGTKREKAHLGEGNFMEI